MKRTFRRIFSLSLCLMMVFLLALPASASTMTIVGKDEYEFSPGSEYHATDLFGRAFKDIMPGDRLTQTITIQGEFGLFKEDSIKVSMKGLAHGANNPLAYSERQEEREGKDDTPINNNGRDETVASMEDFLSRLDLKITNKTTGTVIFNAKADEILTQTVLGTFRNQGKVQLEVELYWDPTSTEYDYNQYANRVGEVDWVFTVSAYDDPDVDNPKTGDYIMIAAVVMLLSGAALVILLVSRRKKRN